MEPKNQGVGYSEKETPQEERDNWEHYESIKNNPKLKAVFWALFTLSVFSIVYIFRFYLWPALFALLVFIILNPIYSRGKRFFRGWENLWAFLLIMGAFFLLFLPAAYLVLAVSREAVQASALMQHKISIEYLTHLAADNEVVKELLQRFGMTSQDVVARGVMWAQKGTNFFVQHLTGLIQSSLGLAFDLLLTTVILFFLLKESDRIERSFYSILPFPNELERRIVRRTARVIRDVFYGNLIIMIAQGIGVFVVFAVFGVPSALLWAVIGGIFSVIPVVSTTPVWLPVVIVFFAQGQYTEAVLIGVFALAIAQTLENVVKPLILDKKLNIHPLVLFFALFGGLQAFGVVGLILGPVIITLFMTFMEAYRVIEEFKPQEQKLKDSSDPGATDKRAPVG